MKKSIIATAVAVICAFQGYAADTTTATNGQGERQGQGQSIEQKKAEMLQHIEERITNSQAEMVCVKSALSHEELRACREKYRPQQQKNENSDKNRK